MMGPFLLDTCAALWIVAGEIHEATAQALTQAAAAGLPTYISPITAWEVGLLARKGRFHSPYSPQRWFDRLMAVPGAALAEMSPQILLESSFLPGELHGDPADRILAATAREYGYTVMTRDRALLAYGEEGHIRALEC
jgi:PIN domain nuclease of toxin-antitoxin system